MTSVDLCLSIDLGTGGPKVGLVTLEGELVTYEIHHVPTVFTSDGGAVQDAELWWTIICDAAKRLLAQPAVEARRVKAVAVTGQYASTVPVDADGLPTGPCLTWLDTTRARPCTSFANLRAPLQHRVEIPSVRSSTSTHESLTSWREPDGSWNQLTTSPCALRASRRPPTRRAWPCG
jgi:sugar (pentulose or hexulose) kinase